MQDAERLQEHVDQVVVKAEAEAKADVSEAHHKTVVQQRHAANRELSKFKFLAEVFTLGENLLNQRKGVFRNRETPPEAYVIEGLEGALVELGRISRQAQDAIMRNDGSQSALHTLEEAFKQEQTQAAATARGLAVTGQRAVDAAASRVGELVAPPEGQGIPTASEGTALLDTLDKSFKADGSAKEPIASP